MEDEIHSQDSVDEDNNKTEVDVSATDWLEDNRM